MTLHEWCCKHNVQAWQFAGNNKMYYLPDGTWDDRWELFKLTDFFVSGIVGGTLWFYPKPTELVEN